MAKAVVTGGAGFIGSHVVDALVTAGHDVHVLDNFAAGRTEDRLNTRATYWDADMRSPESARDAFVRVDWLFHLAALPRVQASIEDPVGTTDVNMMGMLRMLEEARTHGLKKFIYAASSSAYGTQDTLPLTEDMPTEPMSPYAFQKVAGENMCKAWSAAYGVPTVSLRFFNVYGPRLDPEGPYALVIGKFLQLRQQGKPLPIVGDGTQTRDFTHVSDVVRAMCLAAESSTVGSGEIINIGSGRNVSINNLAAMFGGPVEHIDPRIEPHDTLADISRAKKLLGWEPLVSIDTGIAELKQLFHIS